MICQSCGTDNVMGCVYCAGCGAKLEMSDAKARVEAVAAVRHEGWEKAFKAMTRTLFLFSLVFLGSLFFRAYAVRPVIAQFGSGAPLPPPPPIALTPSVIRQVELPIPSLPEAVAIKPDKADSGDILAGLSMTARDRLNCSLRLKSGGMVKGILLSRTPAEMRVIVGWGPPLQVRAIASSNVDVAKSELPEYK